MLLYHYYDKIIGHFKNLSDLTIEQANRVLQEIAITKPNVQCAKRFDLRTISFTYGDSHPTFSDRINDEKEYRKRLDLKPIAVNMKMLRENRRLYLQ